MKPSHMLASLLTVAVQLPTVVAVARPGVADELERHFQRSRIEIQNQKYRGTVTRSGRVLTVAFDGATAKRFRVAQTNTKSPAFHVIDYARVDVMPDRRIGAEPAPLVLPRGTRVVILDMRLRGEQLRLKTHTAAALARAMDGSDVFGCTEFVFTLEPELVARGDVAAIVAAVERWLASSR